MKPDRSAPIYIRRSRTKKEFGLIHEFISKEYGRWFGSAPKPAQVLFGAWQNGILLGAIGLDFKKTGSPLPFEVLFDCTLLDCPALRKSAKGVQLGRWVALVRGISGALIYTACSYAIHRGKRYGWYVAKKKAANRMFQLGIIAERLDAASMRSASIPEGDLAYYASRPRPRLYLFDLVQARQCLLPQVRSLKKRDRIRCTY